MDVAHAVPTQPKINNSPKKELKQAVNFLSKLLSNTSYSTDEFISYYKVFSRITSESELDLDSVNKQLSSSGYKIISFENTSSIDLMLRFSFCKLDNLQEVTTIKILSPFTKLENNTNSYFSRFFDLADACKYELINAYQSVGEWPQAFSNVLKLFYNESKLAFENSTDLKPKLKARLAAIPEFKKELDEIDDLFVTNDCDVDTIKSNSVRIKDILIAVSAYEDRSQLLKDIHSVIKILEKNEEWQDSTLFLKQIVEDFNTGKFDKYKLKELTEVAEKLETLYFNITTSNKFVTYFAEEVHEKFGTAITNDQIFNEISKILPKLQIYDRLVQYSIFYPEDKGGYITLADTFDRFNGSFLTLPQLYLFNSLRTYADDMFRKDIKTGDTLAIEKQSAAEEGKIRPKSTINFNYVYVQNGSVITLSGGKSKNTIITSSGYLETGHCKTKKPLNPSIIGDVIDREYYQGLFVGEHSWPLTIESSDTSVKKIRALNELLALHRSEKVNLEYCRQLADLAVEVMIDDNIQPIIHKYAKAILYSTVHLITKFKAGQENEDFIGTNNSLSAVVDCLHSLISEGKSRTKFWKRFNKEHPSDKVAELDLKQNTLPDPFNGFNWSEPKLNYIAQRLGVQGDDQQTKKRNLTLIQNDDKELALSLSAQYDEVFVQLMDMTFVGIRDSVKENLIKGKQAMLQGSFTPAELPNIAKNFKKDGSIVFGLKGQNIQMLAAIFEDAESHLENAFQIDTSIPKEEIIYRSVAYQAYSARLELIRKQVFEKEEKSTEYVPKGANGKVAVTSKSKRTFEVQSVEPKQTNETAEGDSLPLSKSHRRIIIHPPVATRTRLEIAESRLAKLNTEGLLWIRDVSYNYLKELTDPENNQPLLSNEELVAYLTEPKVGYRDFAAAEARSNLTSALISMRRIYQEIDPAVSKNEVAKRIIAEIKNDPTLVDRLINSGGLVVNVKSVLGIKLTRAEIQALPTLSEFQGVPASKSNGSKKQRNHKLDAKLEEEIRTYFSLIHLTMASGANIPDAIGPIRFFSDEQINRIVNRIEIAKDKLDGRSFESLMNEDVLPTLYSLGFDTSEIYTAIVENPIFISPDIKNAKGKLTAFFTGTDTVQYAKMVALRNKKLLVMSSEDIEKHLKVLITQIRAYEIPVYILNGAPIDPSDSNYENVLKIELLLHASLALKSVTEETTRPQRLLQVTKKIAENFVPNAITASELDSIYMFNPVLADKVLELVLHSNEKSLLPNAESVSEVIKLIERVSDIYRIIGSTSETGNKVALVLESRPTTLDTDVLHILKQLAKSESMLNASIADRVGTPTYFN